MGAAPVLPSAGDVLLLTCRTAEVRCFTSLLPGWLRPDDAERFRGIRSEPVRLAFSAGRLLLGWVERRAHGGSRGPDLGTGPHGKPFFRRSTPWRFSLSHAAGQVLLAVTRDREIGVDLEHALRRAAFERLALRAFHAREREWWSGRGALPEDFLRLWTLKESWLKTGGEGISIDLQALDTTPWLDGGMHAGRSAGFPATVPGYLVSVVVEGALERMETFQLSGQDLIVPGLQPG